MKTVLKPGDSIYEIGIDPITKEVKSSKLIVLCVGDQFVFAKGLEPILSYERETIFSLSKVNMVDPSKVLESKFTSIWADSLEKVDELISTIEKVIDFKNQFKKAI